MVLSIEREVIALLGLEVAVTKRNLGFSAIDGVVMIVKLVQSWRTETCGVGGTETECSGCIHQRGFWCEVVAEILVVGDASTYCRCEVLQKLLLVLTVEGEGVGTLVNIARCGKEAVLPPVHAEDGGAVFHQSQDALHVSFISMLLLRQHEVSHLVAFGCHFVILAVAETVGSESGLQGVLGSELVDAAHIPAEALVLHLIIGTACHVGVGVGTVGNLIRIVKTSIQSQLVVGRIGEFLSYDAGAVTREEGSDAGLCFSVGAFHILQAIDTVTVCTIVGEGGVGSETMGEDIQCDSFCQLPFPRNTSVAGHTDKVLGGLVGDDVDDTCNGITSVKRRSRSIQHLNALHASHIDAVQIDIVGNVACQLLTIDEDENVLVAQSVQTQERTHRVGCHRHLWHHACQCTIESAYALLVNLLGREYTHGSCSRFESLMMSRPCHDDRVKIVVALSHSGVAMLHSVYLGKSGAPA